MQLKLRLTEVKNPEPKRDHGNIKELKESIKEVGLICPITVSQKCELLAGRRRFQAVSELGWQEVECNVIQSDGDLFDLKVSLEENLKLKNLTDPEVAVAIAEYDEMKRLVEGEIKPGGKNGAYKSFVNGEGWTQQKTATDLGIKQQQVAQAIKIAQAVKQFPDFASWKSGQLILTEYKRRTVKPTPLPADRYRTIVVGPPWPMEKILRNVAPNQSDMDYPTMTIEQIKGLPIPKLALEDGCHIYLWTTHKFLPVAFEIYHEWDVKYECLLTWVKNVGFTPFSWMYSTEHCLFGRVGRLPLLQQGKCLDFEGKVREHSRKPDEFYQLVRWVSPEPRIDIFSRERREGFEQYGDECARFSAR